MSAVLGKVAQTATKIIHSREVRHDAALFAGALVATGVINQVAGGHVALSWDVLSAAVVTAGRRALVLRLAGK